MCERLERFPKGIKICSWERFWNLRCDLVISKSCDESYLPVEDQIFGLSINVSLVLVLLTRLLLALYESGVFLTMQSSRADMDVER